MTQGNPLPTLTATQARELEGHRWTIEGQALRFANRDPSYPGSVPFRQGSEGIAYPLLDGTGQPGVYAKFFHKTSVTRKRVQRAQWLVNQRVDTWAPTLIGAPYCWANTQDTGRPEGIGFDFTCSLAVATPGMTWQEVKLGIADGDIQLAPEFRERCAKDLIRALAKLEQSDFMHGDLSDGNVMVDINAPDGTPASVSLTSTRLWPVALVGFSHFLRTKAARSALTAIAHQIWP